MLTINRKSTVVILIGFKDGTLFLVSGPSLARHLEPPALAARCLAKRHTHLPNATPTLVQGFMAAIKLKFGGSASWSWTQLTGQ